jgi:PKD repeat protein
MLVARNISLMKKTTLFFLSFVLVISVKTVHSQTWVDKMQDPTVNFYDVKTTFNTDFDTDKQKELKREQKQERKEKREKAEQEEKNKGVNPSKLISKNKDEEAAREVPNFEIYKRWENYMEPRLYPSGDRSVMVNAWKDYLDTFYADQSDVSTPGQKKNTNSGNQTKAAQSSTWSIIGPTTTIPSGGGAGRVNFVRFDPTNSNTIYVGSPAGGLWKSTTSGTGWTTNTDNLAVIGCTDLAINPTNTQIMYLATGDGEAGDTYSIGVLKSTNGGTTWSPSGLNWLVTNGRKISKLLMNPQNPNTIFAASSNGLYRTLNAGTTWTQISTAVANLKDIEYKPGDTTTVYTCSTTLFYKSTNGGTSFVSTATGLPASSSRLAIGVTANDPTYVYVVSANNTDYGFQGLFLSTNSGTSFTSKSTTPNLLGFNSNGGDAGGQGWYTLSIAVSPLNKAQVMIGGVNIWRSTDSGVNWTLNAQWTGSGAPYVHADIHALEYLPGSGTTYFAGCDGGFFKTTTSGGSWSDLSNGLQISEAYRLGLSTTNSNLLVSGLQDNGTVRNSGTTNWSYVQGGDGMECLVDYSNANIQYGELYYGDINKTSTGGGLNTNIVTTGGTGVNSDGDWVTPFIEAPSNAATLFVGKDQVYKSTNSGTSWAVVGSITGGTGSVIALANAASNINYIYAAKIDKFYVSTNGTSFTDRSAGLPVASAAITYIAVHPTNPSRVWVTFSGYSAANKVWYSSDAGVTWSNYSTGLPNLPANCVVYQTGSASEILYVGTDVGVYVRDNTASAWTSYFTGLPNVIVKELEIQYSVSKLRAATFGRGIWQTDLYVSGAALPVADFSANRTNLCAGNTVTYTDLTNGTPIAWNWLFPGGTPGTSTAQNPTVTYNTAGAYDAQLIVTNANGKDTMLKTGYITVTGPIALPLVEGFQGAIFAPSGWVVNNPDGDITWEQTAAAGGFGTSTSSALFDNYTPPNTTAGTVDDFYTPKYIFTGITSAKLKFDVAYCRLNSTLWDSLIVLASTDCGSTWARIYAKGGTGLATAPDKSGSGIFVPTAAQWRTDSVNLAAYVGQGSVMFNFQSISGWGQALYLDNINITGAGTSTVASIAIAETTGSNPTCSGASVTFTATPTNGGTTPSYQWKVNGTNVGTNSATYTTTTLTTGQAVTCVMTSNLSGVTGNPATSNAITMTVTASVTPAVAIAASPTGAICAGTSVTFTATPTNGGATPVYQWKVNGVNAGTNSTAFSTTTLTNGQIVTCVLTSNAICASTTTATSSGITMIVNTPVTPSVSIVASPTGAVCTGASVTFTATPTNGGTTPVYQWKVNGVNAGTNSATFTSTTLTNGQIVTCVLTSGATCASPATATSSGITMTVNSSVTPAVTIVASPTGTICAGTSVTFTATPLNGGATPSYQWQVNGANAGTNSATFTTTTLTNAQIVTCVLTSNAACASPTTATSSGSTMTVNPSVTPTVSIVANPTGAICPGTSVTFTATPANGGSVPSYQWKINGLNAGTNSSTFATTALTNGQTVTCVLTSNAACASSTTATSAGISVAVNAAVTPSVTIAETAGGNPACAGSNLTFTATPTNGGTTPVYQWNVNGTNVGTNSATYTTSTLTNGQTVTCDLTSNATCASPATISSAGITITINPVLVPAITIASNTSGAVCTGSSVTFTATPNNAGTTPAYQWQMDGSNAGTNNAIFTTASLTNNQVVTCVLTSNATCASPVTATSSGITMAVNATLVPAVAIAITGGSNPTCTNQAVTFTATPTNGGTTPSYQWMVNNTNVGSNSATFTSSTLANSDVVTCVMTSSSSCASPTTANSSGITMVMNATIVPAVSIAITSGSNPSCANQSITFTASATNGGTTPSYLWQVNGANAGANSATFTSTTLTNGNVVSCVMTSNSNCASPTSANSSNITMSITPTVIPTISIVANPSGAICVGNNVTFAANTTDGGASPAYLWQVNGVTLGSNSPVYATSTLSNNDLVTCMLTSNAACASPTTANSTGLTMIVNTIPATPTITQNGMLLTSSASTGNQWYLNGIAIAGATSQTFGVTQNGNYTVSVTNNGCASNTSSQVSIINTDVLELTDADGLSVYPNPSDGYFTISFNAIVKSTYTVELRNTLGQLIYKDVVTDYNGTYSKPLTVAEYGKGVYVISLIKSNNITVKKVVVY